jgi:hypothetical protein
MALTQVAIMGQNKFFLSTLSTKPPDKNFFLQVAV